MPGLADRVVDAVVDSGRCPDAMMRRAIRLACRRRLRHERRRGVPLDEFVRRSRTAPVAPLPEAANEQHYEVPAALYEVFLGPRLKYSGCVWPQGVTTLAQAEEAMLALTCERAGVEDGMDVLDLGCGWGSLSLWVCERYPSARVTAVSNSHGQRRFVEQRAAERGVANLHVVTADVASFEPGARFDRVVSVEMFEHMRNYEALLARIAGWLRPHGRLFVHVFAHRSHAYLFERSWMARRFFTAGTMPSHGLWRRFDHDLAVTDEWWLDGTHYARTAEAWLARLDGHADEARAVLDAAGSPTAALARWRVFLLACAELFAYEGGAEWGVSHTLLAPSVST